jgi:phosphopentomutase
MPRAIILVIDSFGIGATPDADLFGDVGANTLGSIAEVRAASADGPLRLPFLAALGLGEAARLVSGQIPPGLERENPPRGLFGAAREVSKGKDTPSGHWELAGTPVRFDWGYFPDSQPCFPPELIAALVAEAELPGVLGDKHASGTTILEELGEEHIRTGKPIVYTSADSVFQIAAHEEHFGLDRLYAVCQIARRLVDPLGICRIIARPFLGENGPFQRTGNRRDYAVPPPTPTLLDHLKAAGREVVSIGKIADIFAHRGLTRCLKATGDMALFDLTLQATRETPDGGLIFTNFVDFDSLYGHRRDPQGYARALEAFDRRLPELEALLQPGDLVLLTADHGCDPRWKGSDHTREHVPMLGFGPALPGPKAIGIRETFADLGQTVAKHLGVEALDEGTAFL